MLREMIHGKMLFLHPKEFWEYFSGLPGQYHQVLDLGR